MQIPGRDVGPDIKYNSKLVAKMTNYLMQDGKKTVAERVVYNALEQVGKRNDKSSLDVLNEAVTNCTPMLEVRTRRVGGANYQVPYEVPKDRGLALALRWILEGARGRGERTMAERLAAELTDAANKEGKAFAKRIEAHRMAQANRAFAHYRW